MRRLELGLEEDFDNTGDGQLRVPGFGYDYCFELDYMFPKNQDRFRHGANDFKQWPRLTAREVAMMGVMNVLTDKKDWHEKVFDDVIVARWKEEARSVPLISDMAWEWCLTELRDKARRFEHTGRVLVFDAGSRISKSDQRVTETLRQELKDAVRPLLERPDSERDWHPGSDGKVLNLVHPSLFPLVYGRTKVLVNGGKVPLDFSSAGSYKEAETASDNQQPPPSRGGRWCQPIEEMWSRKFQWLPCEVEFTESTGTDVEITSYINNLHPTYHAAVYAAIEKIIPLAIAPWNEVLVHGSRGRTPPRIRTYGAQFTPELPEWQRGLYLIEFNRESNPEAYALAREKVLDYVSQPVSADQSAREVDKVKHPMYEPENIMEKGGLGPAVRLFYERNLRKVVHPEPGVSFSYDQWKAGLTGKGVVEKRRPPFEWNGISYGENSHHSLDDHDYYSLRIQDDFRDEGLQVIIKLSSIELTPEKPKYDGGNWHIEGLLNEHIAATALYYYDVDNVTESRISFRTEASFDNADMIYEQDDHAPLVEIFGIASGSLRQEPPYQNLGSVSTPQGRLLAFPNTLQHKVEPFELIDKKRPGHRRFLVLWLVDPHYRICSTRNVPPQQESWWDGVGTKPQCDPGAPVTTTPGEKIPEGLMSLKEAKELRLELMAERTKRVKDMESAAENYNFCEH
ncbi:hypothetical protein KVR01_009070 [Diaporthe batatas]|uniref:uncharacterized protein n=1 Tax=Diaporthe batatas TaxID=748121 RepID=UPI001D04DDFD|nr:uncharacterized protein KVR01_009070 [Diaporthe batatas]KAG8160806.1 hypothetical protein KVR01_009070 [Diaporthe batatas]